MTIEQIPQVEELLKKIMPMPAIAKDTVTAMFKGWTRVTYTDAITKKPVTFAELPTIVAVMETRGGKPPTVTAPTITILGIKPVTPTTITVPTMTLPAAPTISIPLVDIPPLPKVDIPVITIAFLNLSFPFLTSDIGWVQNQICTPVNRIVEQLYFFQTRANDMINFINRGFAEARKSLLNAVESIKTLRDNTQASITKYRDSIQYSVNGALTDTRDKTQAALNDYRTRIETGVNKALEDVRSKTQIALSEYQANIQTAINKGLSEVIPKLYEQIGLPSDQLLSTINIRNVATTSFEFYALSAGAKLHYVAIGKT